MKTTLTRSSSADRVRLNGAKWHVTNAPIADALVVFAVDGRSEDRFLTAVLVRPGDRGVRLGPPLDLIGCKGSPTGEVFLEDVELPVDRVLGRAQDGRKLLELAFVRERVLAPWALIGKMERVIGECLDHVERRAQFGKALHEFQYVQEKIVSSFEQLLHARHLAERAVAMVAEGVQPGAIASLAKAAAADAAVHTFRSAIEVFGSYGVQRDRRLGEYLDDALCAQIAGGTRETHKKIVFGELRVDRARARSGRPSRLLRREEES
jgi:isovaleryl-CoA dehydrogenase